MADVNNRCGQATLASIRCQCTTVHISSVIVLLTTVADDTCEGREYGKEIKGGIAKDLIEV